MKLVSSTLVMLYINLFMVISLLVCSLGGLIISEIENWLKWLLLFVVIITGIINVVFGVINIINTLRLFKNGEYNSLRKRMKVLKFGTIPYFIINFVLYFLLFMLFFAASRGFFILTPMPLLFLIPTFFTYLTVVLTSVYGIGFVAILKRERRITTGKLIIHILLQLCFVLDIIDTIVLVIKHKAVKKELTEMEFI